jgi:hypothetical protein
MPVINRAARGSRHVPGDTVVHRRKVALPPDHPGESGHRSCPIDSLMAARVTGRNLGRVDTSLVKPVRGAVLESIARVCFSARKRMT